MGVKSVKIYTMRKFPAIQYLLAAIFYMGPYGGASGAERPKNGASHLRSYLGEETHLYSIRILHESSGSDGTQHYCELGLFRAPMTKKQLPIIFCILHACICLHP